MTIYGTQKKLIMGKKTRCPICGAVNKNTVMMDKRTVSSTKYTCPYCGRVLDRLKKKKMLGADLKEIFLRMEANLQKLADDRVIPRP